ncbi:MAG: cation transporter [Butyricicoccaceae bacterium]
MKKTFKLEDLDCANCAAAMERGINALDGVNSATVNFMGMKLILDADDARFEEILKAAQKVADKYDTTIVR